MGIVKDHLGNTYANIKEMCNRYGFSLNTYYTRLNLGWDIEKILTTPLKTNATKDHLGNEYPSIKAMCKAYNINCSTFQDRLKNGWSLEDALTKPLENLSCTDHLGNKYASVNEMCKHYNIKASIYLNRIHHGWSIEKALTENKKIITECTDFEGTVFPSFSAMCKHYGKSECTVSERLRKGIDLKTALTSDKIGRIRKVYDHEGNEFHSYSAMAKFYGHSSWTTVRDRMNDQNMTLEEALTCTGQIKKISCKDPYGSIFKSITEMCKHYNINRSVYREDIINGYTMIEALRLVPKLSRNIKNVEFGDLLIIECADHSKTKLPNYFICAYLNDPVTKNFIMTRGQLLLLFEKSLKNIKSRCVS